MRPMENNPANKVYVIVNPISGVRRKGLDDFREMLAQNLDLEIFEPELFLTAYGGHAVEIARQGLDAGIKYFIVVGGDGTVNEVSGVLAGSDAIMGILPAGSGNGLAHHLEIPVKIKEAVYVFNRQRVLRIDTCEVNKRFFVSIAGVGFDAKVARRFARSRRRGFISYARIVFKEYFTYKPREYRLILDGKLLKVSAFFISFANSSQFGYNTRIAPGASMTDGMLDVCVVKKPPIKAFPGIAHLFLRHRANRSKYMDTYQAARVEVKRKKGKSVNVDGEAVKMEKNLSIEIRPATLNVVVP